MRVAMLAEFNGLFFDAVYLDIFWKINKKNLKNFLKLRLNFIEIRTKVVGVHSF